ncbi:glycoside hydrolase family 88 protein [Thermophagus sp. OGC60D27]|uniref:glycoside hydrolase family 88 protein n=1 Tax=Thermophagus sp. OGC60D27 TaxID=3458415 RepID=UPI0040380192
MSSCKQSQSKTNFERLVDKNLEFAEKQTKLMAENALSKGWLPRALHQDGSIYSVGKKFDWTEGFFPGSCWYLYEYSKNPQWKEMAQKLQASFEEHRFNKHSHDLGFVFYCSHGNGYRLTNSDSMKQVLIDAGNSLITRYDSTVGCIKSWDVDRGWQSNRNWEYPVIIDNMMNLELLFRLSEITGDPKYQSIAISHADKTLENHFRKDGSSYHVVDYDSISGVVRSRQTAQGFSDESAWARGQAWGLYGFTICYRFTHQQKYLDQALKIARYILKNANLPEDKIPYWDFMAPNIPAEPRDASAAAITASALIELSGYVNGGDNYMDEAVAILKSLSSKQYRAGIGENGNFILKHSVGSIPHKSEVDVPIVYADYYYIEALIRLMNYDNPIK